MAQSLQARVYAQVEKTPDRRALAFIDYQGRFTWQTLAQVYSRAAGYGERFAELGCNPGDVCLLVLPSNEFCATVLLATLLRGGVPLLIAPPILQEGANSNLLEILKGILKRTHAKLVIAHETLEKHREKWMKKTRSEMEKKEEEAIADVTQAQYFSRTHEGES